MRLLSIGEFARRSRLSPKALRLYDELGILTPARVDAESGYRWYSLDQLDPARLVAVMRQVGLSLDLVRQVLEVEPDEGVALVSRYWEHADAEHRHRGELAGYLLDRLQGRNPIMYDVTTRAMPTRTVLCMKRHVTSQQKVWDLGKEFLAYFRERPRPLLDGREGAPFLVYHGEISADSDGPVEFCRPIADDDATAIASQYPELVLRTEPAHEEAVVHLGPSPQDDTPWAIVFESLQAWASQQRREPSNLGMRLTYLVNPPRSATSVPDIDVAVPLTGG
ncbi:MAG: MerR family transcriptional regulator [Actinomycetota bacterium]|nr:MerR family transcriptional regulator [Actinomycetota bacterium]